MRFDRIASSLLGALILLALACVPLRGGWDVDALVSKEPAIAALEGQRLGDMLPFPALDGDGIALVACRYVEGQSVRVHGGGPHWPGDWGRAAVRALNRSVEGVDLVFEEDGGSIAKARPSVEIVALEAIGGAGPVGLGDTLSECDVSPIRPSIPSERQVGKRAFRGVLTGAEIRMRRAQLDMSGQVREASEEEWVGALMHELAHSLGFAGHVAAGDSILVRDERKIRAAGRRALVGGIVGEVVADETLEALYRLRPGQLLGTRTIRAEDLPWLRSIRELDRVRSGMGRPLVGMFASVGDREARIVWRYSDGSQLGIRLPHWQSELRSGSGITLRPDRTTRLLIDASAEIIDSPERSIRRDYSSSAGSRARAFEIMALPASVSPTALSTMPSRNRMTASSGAWDEAISRCSRARVGSDLGCL
jgi:hypothetical protein